MAWPPRSPDLTSYYFLWSHLKTVIYSAKTRSLDELKVRIINAIHEISEQQMRNVFNELEYRFERCVLNDGGYVGG
jgi:transposase